MRIFFISLSKVPIRVTTRDIVLILHPPTGAALVGRRGYCGVNEGGNQGVKGEHQNSTQNALHDNSSFSILYSAAGGGDKEYKAAHESIGGKKANNKPTIVNPESYRDRFLQSMYKYFILVPDFRYRPEEGKK